MFDAFTQAKAAVRTLIDNAIAEAVSNGQLAACDPFDFGVEIPADPAHGDLSSNAALVSARVFRSAPQKIAAAICENMRLEGSPFSRCEIAGPGFINFFFAPSYYGSVVEGVLREGESYGHTGFGAGKKLMVEFVSANPTGPMHLGNARGGALGDCLASVLQAAGYDVSREFYVNDTGNQINNFGLSLEARYLQLFDPSAEFPDDGYHGEDIIERAKQFADIHKDAYVGVSSEERQKALIDFALPLNIQGLKDDLLKYRISYDKWFLESTLYSEHITDKVMGILKDNGMTYESEGALWLKKIGRAHV